MIRCILSFVSVLYRVCTWPSIPKAEAKGYGCRETVGHLLRKAIKEMRYLDDTVGIGADPFYE